MAVDPLLQQAHAHVESQRWDEAAAVCQRILRRDPRNGEALALRGVVAARQGDDADAARWLAQAIKLLPHRWDLYFNVGLVLRRLGRLDDAAQRLRKAVLLKPDASAAHFHLGSVLAERGASDEAIAAYRRAIELAPDHAKARAALADLLHGRYRIEEAASQYEQALALDDGIAEAWFGLGHIALSAGDHARAVACFRRCVELDAAMLRGWFGLGCAELARKHYAAAAEAFGRCVQIDPAYAQAHQNLGQSLFNLGEVDAAIEHFRRVLEHAAGGPEAARLTELALRSIAVVVPGSSRADHAAVRDARAAWGAVQRSTPATLASAARTARERLKIGYVSAFFGSDNWMKPVWGLAGRHDRRRFHVHLFSDGPLPSADGEPAPGAPTSRIRDDDVFCDLSGLDNDAAAARIAEHGIDILIDLNGYSRMDRFAVFARRPAPVAVAWFNMFATTGLPWFDYLIGDDHVIRADEEAYYTETVLRVPGSYLTFSVDYPVPEVQPPPCAARGDVTFGCLASQYKITDEVLAAWSEILHACPSARLLVKNAALGVREHRHYLIDKLTRLGVGADRVELRGPDQHFAFLTAYDEVDIALDTFPYNGGTTTTEAIWQGVPVVTFDGDRWASRTSVTLLREAGLGDWVAADRNGYVELAAAWGRNASAPARLAELRRTMRDRLRSSSVCDTQSFARAMEELYLRMWRSR
jgi:predicted O-linked N-acetylglucosamine transferase (SPINDLY family)